MKFIILDCSTHVVLAQTTEIRVVAFLKSVLVDVTSLVLLPNRHAEAYNLITNSYIAENIFRYHKQKCEPAINVIEETNKKKHIAGIKTIIAETLMKCADMRMHEHHTFFDNHMLSIILENNVSMIEEYALIRNIKFDEASKELLLRKSSYDMHVIKIQALIDKWTERIALENDIDKLLGYQSDIIQEFFYR